MKTITINYTVFNILASLETDKDITLIVKRPKGKKQYLAYQFPDGTTRLSNEMPTK